MQWLDNEAANYAIMHMHNLKIEVYYNCHNQFSINCDELKISKRVLSSSISSFKDAKNEALKQVARRLNRLYKECILYIE